MILDKSSEFADAATAPTATGTANLGDVVDLGTGDATDPGHGEPMYLVITADTAPVQTGTGTGTLAFKLVSDSTATPSTTTATVHITTPTTADVNNLSDGEILYVGAIPDGQGAAYERYLGVQVVVGGTVHDTAGKFNAFLTKDPHRWEAVADAVN